MCEMIVMVQDKIHDDPYMDAKQFKRGDVVVVQKDGHAWGVDELSNPLWVILKFPLVSINVGRSFVGSEKDTDAENPSEMLRPRAFYLDLENLPEDLNNVSEEILLSHKIAKEPLSDPNILG